MSTKLLNLIVYFKSSYLQDNKMFRRIKPLHNLIIARQHAIKITQIPSKFISRADRIKKLNYENKYMYGAKHKEKEAIVNFETDAPEEKNDKNMSSEIYWTCLHVPEVQDFTKVSTKKKAKPKAPKKIKDSLVEDKTEVLLDKARKKFEMKLEKDPAKKKSMKEKLTRIIVKVPELPETLTQLQKAFPEAKAEINQALNRSFKIRPIQLEKAANDKKIPFESHQLRAIPNFPISLGNTKITSSFENLLAQTSTAYLPSVSKVLQATMPEIQRQALIQWKNFKISELGLEGFEKIQQSHLSRGKEFHQCLQKYFKGEIVEKSEIEPEVLPIWHSIEPLLGNFQAPGVLIEEKVKHKYLLYQGVIDCVSFHDSTLSVIEWKKSDRQKKSLSFTYDAPIQLCAYLGALNASREEFHQNPIKNGIVVVAYNDGSVADIFQLKEYDIKKYWKLWLHRLQEYWVRYKDNTLPESI